MDSHSDETAHDVSLREFGKDEKYKEQSVKEIIAAICAMLNSYGGMVTIHFKSNNNDSSFEDSSQLNILPNVDSFPLMTMVTRILDQSMISIIGVEQTISKIKFKQDAGSLTVSVERADSLITTNYNLYSPSQTQVVKISPLKPPKEIKDSVIDRKAVVPEPVQLGTHCRTFYKDKKCGFDESTMCQIKHLKADPSKRTTLADRMISKGNKFSCYVSGFANHNGGHIYYGISDNTKVVEGEGLPNERRKQEISKKVSKAINKMIWPKQIGQPKRGENWEIFFEPVLDESLKPVPSTFVIVIYIAPCLGGVFTDVPECYEMVKGKVSKMSFATWKKRISQPVLLRKSESKEEIPHSFQLITWSSDATRKAFTVGSETLRKEISNGNWESVRNECNSRQKLSYVTHCNNLRETMKLLILFKQITASIRKGRFRKARKSLMLFNTRSLEVKDSFIFEVLGLYLEATLKRASGNFEVLKDILKDVLLKAGQIEPGLVTATVYIFTATVSDLISLELPSVLTMRALEHLKCVPDSSDVLAAMRTKSNMILATSHLGSNISGQLIKDRIDISSLKEAKSRIKAIYKSSYKEHPQSVYYDVQFNLVLLMFKYRHSQLYPDQRTRDLLDACSYAKKARSLAVKYGFKEMVKWSENNKYLCALELERAGTPVIQNHRNDVTQRSTYCSRDITQNAESQFMSDKSQNLDDPNVERRSRMARALKRLKCVPDSSDDVADIRRKENINSATFHLGCVVSGQLTKGSIDISSLKNAKNCIKAIYKSTYEEYPLSLNFDVQLNFVLLMFKYRHSQLYPDQRTRDLRDACSYGKKAQILAAKFGFTEIVKWSSNYQEFCDQELHRAKSPVQNHENDSKPCSISPFHDVTRNAEGPTGTSKPASERNASIEQARQRKLLEEKERRKQQDAASHEKLRLLDERTRPIHVQTHETSGREPGGPRSLGRSNRTTTQRHTRARNNSKDYEDEEIKTGADDEKGQVNVKMAERKFTEDDRRKPDSDRRHCDDDRRQQYGKQHYNTEKRYRDGDRRNVDGEKREPDDAKQQTGERRRKDYSTPHFYDSSKRRDARDTRDEKSFKKGQQSRTSSSKGPVDRAERFRDKTKNSGGFGVPPPPKEQSKTCEQRRKREPDYAKQQMGDRRWKNYSHFNDCSKQRDAQDTRIDRSFKKGQPSRTSSSKGPVDRAERFRDKTKNSGGFGVPPKKSDCEEKSKDEIKGGQIKD